MTNIYKSILVAVDGSKEAEYALHKAIGIAKRNEGSVLNIVNIIDRRNLEAIDRSVYDRVQKESEELLAGYKALVISEGVENVTTIIEYGPPKVVIAKDVAEAVKADLILCGATGLNAVERFLVGSVSGAIVRTAKCDVLVIRTPETL